VAIEVPGTLLLAEAFWLLEGYFVRTLGMHRVYNSAFMNMLRDEENAKYRSYLKKTIEFDPDILKRYVNFMSNPDERTAIDQFGSEDKYFGVATLLATLPGLPMFAHGQIEGYTERYGMEFKQAKMEEWPNEGLVARHQREIAPLLKDRHIFAESGNFVLYDFWTGDGTVNENVFAYSNRHGGQRAVILYNNSYGSTGGTIHMSVGSMDKGSGELRQRSLAEGLGLRWDDAAILAYRDTARGLEYLRRSSDIYKQGMTVSLRGYQYVVLLNWRELHSSAEWPWDRLCDELSGAGVPNLDEAIVKLRLRALHDALREVVSARPIRELATAAGPRAAKEAVPAKKALVKEASAVPAKALAKPAAKDWIESLVKKGGLLFERIPADLAGSLFRAGDVVRYKSALEASASSASRLGASSQSLAEEFPKATRYLPGDDPAGDARDDLWAPVLAWVMLHSLPSEQKAALFDKLQLRSALAEIFATFGLHGEDAWRAAARVRLLLAQEDEPVRMKTGTKDFWAEPDVRWLTGVNESQGATYFNKEAFEELVVWLQLPALVSGASQNAVVEEALLAAKTSGYNVETFTSKKKLARLAEVKDVRV